MSDDPSQTSTEYARLLSLAVHELRTPLSVVSGYLRMLRDSTATGGDPGARQRKMVDDAEKACRRLASLIEELSDLGRLDAGTAAVAVESFDVFALVRDVAATLPAVSDDEARLDVRGPDSGGRLRGDKARLRAAFACIMRAVRREHESPATVVADARLATLDGSPVALIVVALEGEIEWARDAPRAPLNETRGGLGLGLPVARRVVSRFGGSLWSPVATDDDPCRRVSSAFVMVLPLAD